jgi:hypothetical protein
VNIERIAVLCRILPQTRWVCVGQVKKICDSIEESSATNMVKIPINRLKFSKFSHFNVETSLFGIPTAKKNKSW